MACWILFSYVLSCFLNQQPLSTKLSIYLESCNESVEMMKHGGKNYFNIFACGFEHTIWNVWVI